MNDPTRETEQSPQGRWPSVLVWTGVSVAALSAVLGLDRLIGPSVRRAGLIPPVASAPPTAPSFADPATSGLFFEQRDSITVDLPHSMSVAEFLSLYHLENHPAARRALEEQVGASALDDMLEEGESVTFRLTRGRESEQQSSGGSQ